MLIDASAPKDKPETAQMVVIHKAMRREFGLLPQLVGEVPAADPARARLIAAHVELLLNLLHSHHDGEDRLLWPALASRAPLARNMTETMEQQHRTVDRLVGSVRGELTRWSDGDDAARQHLADYLRRLDAELASHLDAEEAEVLPLVHDHVTVAEWESVKDDAAQHMPRNPRLGLVAVGMILADATHAERAWFLSALPAPVRLMWRLAGKSVYTAYVARLSGGDVPQRQPVAHRR